MLNFKKQDGLYSFKSCVVYRYDCYEFHVYPWSLFIPMYIDCFEEIWKTDKVSVCTVYHHTNYLTCKSFQADPYDQSLYRQRNSNLDNAHNPNYLDNIPSFNTFQLLMRKNDRIFLQTAE